jgi:hypothetical protein
MLRRHQHTIWTADDIEGLCGLIACNTPGQQIAKELGCTEKAVKKKAYALGLSFKLTREAPRAPEESAS